jgi:hypothetical protein
MNNAFGHAAYDILGKYAYPSVCLGHSRTFGIDRSVAFTLSWLHLKVQGTILGTQQLLPDLGKVVYCQLLARAARVMN